MSLNSNSSRSRFLTTTLVLLTLAAVVLYSLQHSGHLTGGAIAPAKLAWLGTVLIFWFVLPIYWLMDRSLPQKASVLCHLFLLSMVLRGIVEIYMMYISKNWLHNYGIAHDLFSIGLCGIFALILIRSHRVLAMYFAFCVALFAVEAYFARYLKHVSGGDGSVFFLESNSEHNAILWITWIAVLVSFLVFIFLITRRNSASTLR